MVRPPWISNATTRAYSTISRLPEAAGGTQWLRNTIRCVSVSLAIWASRRMLKQSLTYLLVTIADEGIGSADRLFERRFGWKVRELRVLRLVRDRPGITFTELARLTRFERSATSRILSRLVGAGLVCRIHVAEDGRRFNLTVTAKGMQLCERADPLSLELEELMLAPLTARQRTELLAMMERVLAWVVEGYDARITERFSQEPAGRLRTTRK